MSILNARDAFPPGDNATDTFLGGVHLNLTTLNFWNYTLYSNNTISNESWCMLAFEPWSAAAILPNGTFINGTTCYTPVNPIGARGIAGIGCAVAFGLMLIPILVLLRKHGKLYLPVEKRFYPVGRRWQWYWGVFVCAMALISGFTGIDVDRYYVPELPVVLNIFFWYLMQMGSMAVVWEAIRHWGSWRERQFIDPNPFVLHQTDKRAKFELLIPLVFYGFLWLNFFLIIPRNWGAIELQRSPQQTIEQAVPAATDGRFKAAAFSMFVSWLIVIISARHAVFHYDERYRSIYDTFLGFFAYLEFRSILLIILSLAMIAYQALAAWQFSLSPINIQTNLVAMYVGGWLPSFLILVVQCIAGAFRPNEDRELIRQRRARGAEIDAEMGFVRKPAWWRRVNGDLPPGGMRDRIMRNVREIGGGRATAQNVQRALQTRAQEIEASQRANGNGAGIEMNEMRRTDSVASTVRTGKTAPPPYEPYSGRSDQRRSERVVQAAASMLFPNSETESSASPRTGLSRMDPEERGRAAEASRPGTAGRSQSATSSVTLSAQPQQIRSMLDV